MTTNNTFALDTVRFIKQTTTDSDPFGDRDQVASRSLANNKIQKQSFVSQILQNELLREEVANILAESNAEKDEKKDSDPVTFSDTQLLLNVKKFMLEDDPANLINVLLFWINFQVSHGMPNHNQCVLNVLQDMKNLFVAQNSPSPDLVSSLNDILCTLVQNQSNQDYDSAESIVEFIQLVGVYFMRDYLFERQVITKDLEAFDLLTTWICYTFIMKRQLPLVLSNVPQVPVNLTEIPVNGTDMSTELLQCMQVFEKVNLPTL